MTTRNKHINELYKKYQTLNSHKDFAIKKAIGKFYSVPLEEQDMEYVAWKAFLEVEEKYEEQKGNKTYRSFFIDCLYWKVKDYCIKYSSNKHKACNLAVALHLEKDEANAINDYRDNSILKKLVIEDYVKSNQDNLKSVLVNLYKKDYSIDEMCVEMNCSKNKLYTIIHEVKKDLRDILNI